MTVFQQIVLSMVSSGVLVALITAFSRLLPSSDVKRQEQNELINMGNEFAKELLDQARVEREELRKTLAELAEIRVKNNVTIAKLEQLVIDKDYTIREMETRQYAVASKIRMDLPVTDVDIFGVRLTEASRAHKPTPVLDHGIES